MSLKTASWEQMPSAAKRILLRLNELGAMDNASIRELIFKDERRSPAGRRDLRHSASRLATRSAKNRVHRLVSAGVVAYAPGFSIGPTRYYPIVPAAHPASRVLASPNVSAEAGLKAALVAAGLQRELGFVVGRDRDTLLAYSGGAASYEYRCVHCGTSAPCGLAQVRCAIAELCRFAPHVDGHRVTADVGLRLKSDGSISCAIVWVDDGTPLDGQWAALLPVVALAQERRVRVIVRPHDDSVYSVATKQFEVVHPRLARMLSLIEGAGAKATAGVDAANRRISGEQPPSR